jgi:hypothetical protein
MVLLLDSSVRTFWTVTLSEAVVGRRVGPGQDKRDIMSSKSISVAFFQSVTWQKIAEMGVATSSMKI